MIKFYENRKDIITYACIDHLKTVSKLSVSKSILTNNKYDYLSNLLCNDEIIKIIEESIIKEYTIIRNTTK